MITQKMPYMKQGIFYQYILLFIEVQILLTAPF